MSGTEPPQGANHPPLAARFESAGLDWIVPRWPAPDSVRAFFTTRNARGGDRTAAELDLGPFDLSAMPQERHDAIVENRRLAQAFLPSPPLWLDQVHGASVLDAGDAANRSDRAALRADAAVTRAAGVVLAVRVADCLPVLLSERAGAAIGIAHAGWRGLAAGVLENTVAALGCDPARIVAWLGPAIGAAAFEVGDEVRRTFVAVDAAAAAAFVPGRPGKWHADLPALARQRLARAGVNEVGGDRSCTASDRARFFSYRRDGATGRMAAFIWRTGG